MAALGLGLAGSGVIIFGGRTLVLNGASDVLAWGAAILAPLAYAFTMVVMKHHSKDESAAAMTLGQSLAAAIIVLPFALGSLPVLTPTLSWQVPLVGFLGAAGFLFFVNGLQRLPVSVFAVLDYSALLWAGLLGYIFYGEVPGVQLWIGGALVIAACVLSARSPSRPISGE